MIFSWPMRVLAALLALAVLGAAVQSGRLAHAKADLAKAVEATRITRQDLAQCRANNTELDKARKAQNAAIEALRSDTERRAKMLVDGLESARKSKASAEARAARLLSMGPVGNDACVRAEAAREAVVRALAP